MNSVKITVSPIAALAALLHAQSVSPNIHVGIRSRNLARAQGVAAKVLDSDAAVQAWPDLEFDHNAVADRAACLGWRIESDARAGCVNVYDHPEGYAAYKAGNAAHNFCTSLREVILQIEQQERENLRGWITTVG
jgi:hypothetical protein